MANYDLIASTPTVQVISPTLVEDVLYCTIRTHPSNVIANMTIDSAAFAGDQGAPLLTGLAKQIEVIMSRGHVIAGQGVQTIDPNGLLQDQVAFTVQYVPPNSTSTSITAEALVPLADLLGGFDPLDAFLLQDAEAIVDGVYANLQSTAGG